MHIHVCIIYVHVYILRERGGVKTAYGVGVGGCGRKRAVCGIPDLAMSELKGLPQTMYSNPDPILQMRKESPKEG